MSKPRSANCEELVQDAGVRFPDDRDRGSRPPVPKVPRRRRPVWRVLQLVVGAAVLYGLLPQLLDVWHEVPRLGSVGVVALAAIVALQIGSWWCSGELDRAVLPATSRFVAFTTALASNAIRIVPAAGTALGIRLSYQMWEDAGVDAGVAAAAATATTVVSVATLAAVPVLALGVAVAGAAVPPGLTYVALGGGALFVVLFAAGAVLLTTDGLLRSIGHLAERAGARLGRRVTATAIERQRDQLRELLSTRWRRAVAASAAALGLDYLSLVAALVALRTRPHLSLVLLAFAAAKLLAVVPVTPGGLGLVEAGLVGTLTLAGVSVHVALLATLAYRLASFWLTLPAGLVAWVAYRRRYPRGTGIPIA